MQKRAAIEVAAGIELKFRTIQTAHEALVGMIAF